MKTCALTLIVSISCITLSACGGQSAEEKAKAERSAVESTVRQYYSALLAGNAKRACGLMTPAEAKAAGDFSTELDQVLNSAFGTGNAKVYDCAAAVKSTAKSLKKSEDAKYIRNPRFQSVNVTGNRASVVCCGGKIKPRLTKTGKTWLISGGLWSDQLANLRENTSN